LGIEILDLRLLWAVMKHGIGRQWKVRGDGLSAERDDAEIGQSLGDAAERFEADIAAFEAGG
jgi:hypothetical protein